MKIKHTFGFLLVCLCTVQIQAQTFDKTLNKIPLENRSQNQFKLFQPRFFADSLFSKNYYGFRVGANISNFVGDAEGTSALIGLRIGVLYGRRFNNRASVQLELAYSKQGAQQDEETLQTGVLLDSGLTIATKQNYLALPITFKYYPSQNTGLFLEAGARAAFLLKGELQGTGGQYDRTTDDRIDIADGLNSLDAGILLGVGFTFHKKVDFNLRYNFNFTNYIDEASSLTVDSGNYRNSLLQASIAFYLD